MQKIKLPNKPIYLHPPACAVMMFLFIQTRYLKIKLSLFSNEKERSERLSFNFSICTAALSCRKKKEGVGGEERLTQYMLYRRGISHKHAIWTTNDSQHAGHQSGCYCSSVLINLDQASWVLCRQCRNSTLWQLTPVDGIQEILKSNSH